MNWFTPTETPFSPVAHGGYPHYFPRRARFDVSHLCALMSSSSPGCQSTQESHLTHAHAVSLPTCVTFPLPDFLSAEIIISRSTFRIAKRARFARSCRRNELPSCVRRVPWWCPLLVLSPEPSHSARNDRGQPLQTRLILVPLRVAASAWLIRTNDNNQETLPSANVCPRHLMIIHAASSAYWRRLGGRGRCPPDLPCGVVRKPPSAFCAGRDVVLLWPSAECGIAVRPDTPAGSTRSPPRLLLRRNADAERDFIRRSAIQEMRTSATFASE